MAAEHTRAVAGPRAGLTGRKGDGSPGPGTKKAPRRGMSPGGALKKAAASYSPALQRSTIGAAGLNFSVRDGKRWNPGAMATCVLLTPPSNQPAKRELSRRRDTHATDRQATQGRQWTAAGKGATREAIGQLVALGFGVAAFAPAPYRRRSLRRPSGNPNLADGFALRCFQRLS